MGFNMIIEFDDLLKRVIQAKGIGMVIGANLIAIMALARLLPNTNLALNTTRMDLKTLGHLKMAYGIYSDFMSAVTIRVVSAVVCTTTSYHPRIRCFPSTMLLLLQK